MVLFPRCQRPVPQAASDDITARISRELTGGNDPFYGVSGAVELPDGRIFVAERNDSRVRAFAPDGRELRPIATAGSGPSEVRSPCCLAFTEDGFLVIVDNGNARFQLRRVAGGADSALTVRFGMPNYNAEFRVFARGAGFAESGWHRGSQANRIGRYVIRWQNTGGGVASETEVALPTWDSTTVFAHAYGSTRSNGVRYAYPLYGRKTLRAVAPDGIFAQANSDRYVVELRSARGALLATIDRSEMRGPRLTPAERELFVNQRDSDAKRLEVPVSRLPFRVPDRKSSIRSLQFDDAGELWVERWPAAGELRLADVYDRSAKLLRTVRWPSDVRIVQYLPARSRAIGVRVTEDGESVVVLDLWP